jgi:DNA-binding XRE family transcriptional regulator
VTGGGRSSKGQDCLDSNCSGSNDCCVSNSLAEPNEALQEVGEIIRVHRRKARLTQAQLGSEVALDAPAICRIEQGKRRNLNATTLIRIAQALDIDRDRVLAPLEVAS